MKIFAFVSRYEPSESMDRLAAAQGIELVHIENKNPSEIHPRNLVEHPEGPFDGAVAVHPAAAMRLCWAFPIGVFDAKELHVYDVTEGHHEWS